MSLIEDLRIGTRRFCPACAACLDEPAFDPGVAFCRSCVAKRESVRLATAFSADRQLDLALRTMAVLSADRSPDDGLSPRAMRDVRMFVIDLAASDRNFRDALLADLQALQGKQTRIPRISAEQDIADVKQQVNI